LVVVKGIEMAVSKAVALGDTMVASMALEKAAAMAAKLVVHMVA
jgi:hypothetical protein